MSNSLHITGPWEIRTPTTNVAQQRPVASISCTLKINSFGGSHAGKLFGAGAFQVFVGQEFTGAVNVMPLCFGAGYPLYYHWLFVPGTVYPVALVWNAAGVSSIWVNGIEVQSVTSGVNSTGGTNDYLRLGIFDSSSPIDYQIADLAIWDEYALTQSDVIALRDRTKTPSQVGSGQLSWWSLSGTLGATPTVSDPGFVATGTGLTFGMIVGTAANAVYGGPLVYVPPTTVSPYVSKNGLVNFFCLSTGSGVIQNVTDVAQDPTIQVQFGGSGSLHTVAAWGPVWAPTTKILPFVSYHVACGYVSEVVVQNGGTGYSGLASATASGCVFGLPVISGGVIQSISVITGISTHASPPTITIADNAGSGAIAVAKMSATNRVTSGIACLPSGRRCQLHGRLGWLDHVDCRCCSWCTRPVCTLERGGQLSRPARAGHWRIFGFLHSPGSALARRRV